jgi:hypothetical protein
VAHQNLNETGHAAPNIFNLANGAPLYLPICVLNADFCPLSDFARHTTAMDTQAPG